MVVCSAHAAAADNFTRNIMITGYWPPTNEQVRRYSTNPDQNPGGWLGGNWNSSGYDVYSFFPEFPEGVGRGVGDFEVDYQDTMADWDRIVAEVNPVAIITFSRGSRGRNWEIEGRLQMHAPDDWGNDFSDPARPDLSMPIFRDLVPGEYYASTLPTEAIRQAVVDAGVIPSVLIDQAGGGAFLSEFIGLLGTRHQLLNGGPDAAFRTFAAGHIHVGTTTSVAAASAATDATLGALTRYLDTVIPAPATSAVYTVGFLGVVRPRRCTRR
jgi:pyrrolidone-carboxylate peptidase